MNDEPEDDDQIEVEAAGDGLAWCGAVILIFAIGVTYVVADMTPGIRGPGWIAFAISIVLGELVFRAFRRRLQRGAR